MKRWHVHDNCAFQRVYVLMQYIVTHEALKAFLFSVKYCSFGVVYNILVFYSMFYYIYHFSKIQTVIMEFLETFRYPLKLKIKCGGGV